MLMSVLSKGHQSIRGVGKAAVVVSCIWMLEDGCFVEWEVSLGSRQVREVMEMNRLDETELGQGDCQ